jgi:hypothetical protein
LAVRLKNDIDAPELRSAVATVSKVEALRVSNFENLTSRSFDP